MILLRESTNRIMLHMFCERTSIEFLSVENVSLTASTWVQYRRLKFYRALVAQGILGTCITNLGLPMSKLKMTSLQSSIIICDISDSLYPESQSWLLIVKFTHLLLLVMRWKDCI